LDLAATGAFVVMMVAAVFAKRHARDRTLTSWDQAARTLGLEIEGDRMQGRIGRVLVHATLDRSGSAGPSIQILVVDPLLQPLTLTAETAWTRAAKRLSGSDDVRTGDASFDALVHVAGPEERCLAALSAASRQMLVELIKAGGEVDSGALRVRQLGALRDARELVEPVRRWTAGVEALLVDEDDIPARLTEIVGRDPVAAVCQRALETLVERFPDRAAEAARKAAHQRRDVALRLSGAIALGAEGHPTVRAVADDGSGRPELRIRAVRHLCAKGAISADEAEARLLGLLARADEDGVRIQACVALGDAGSPAAVAALRGVEAGATVLGGGPLRAAAQEAIKAIQARVGAVAAGGLSLVTDGSDAEGALAVAGERGGLAVAGGDAGASEDSAGS
jgi:hypothetical protein